MRKGVHPESWNLGRIPLLLDGMLLALFNEFRKQDSADIARTGQMVAPSTNSRRIFRIYNSVIDVAGARFTWA